MLKTLDLSLQVLELFKGEKNEWSLTEIANYLGENTTKIYRIVETLTKREFLKKNKDSKTYELGISILELSKSSNSMFEIKTLIHPYLVYLTEQTQESSFFTILDENEALTLDSVTGTNHINFAVSVGSTAPLYAGASYRSILAFLPDYFIKATLSNEIKKFTSSTKTNPKDIMKDLEKIKDKGYAVSRGELTDDIVAVAVPILIYDKIIGSITVSGPSYRITDEHIESYINILKQTKEMIESQSSLKRII